MPGIRLVALTKDNWRAVADLKVSPDQTRFVADNLTSIAESQFYPHIERSVITVGDSAVGLAVWGMEPGSSEMWLHRYMIAADHQQKGYGRAALQLLIENWRANPDIRVVKVSYEPDNAVAESLYQEFGFVPGEIAEWDERVATLVITDP